jgi:hypothetical protein
VLWTRRCNNNHRRAGGEYNYDGKLGLIEYLIIFDDIFYFYNNTRTITSTSALSVIRHLPIDINIITQQSTSVFIGDGVTTSIFHR